MEEYLNSGQGSERAVELVEEEKKKIWVQDSGSESVHLCRQRGSTIQIHIPHVMWSAQAVHELKIDHTQRHLSALRGT